MPAFCGYMPLVIKKIIGQILRKGSRQKFFAVAIKKTGLKDECQTLSVFFSYFCIFNISNKDKGKSEERESDRDNGSGRFV